MAEKNHAPTAAEKAAEKTATVSTAAEKAEAKADEKRGHLVLNGLQYGITDIAAAAKGNSTTASLATADLAGAPAPKVDDRVQIKTAAETVFRSLKVSKVAESEDALTLTLVP